MDHCCRQVDGSQNIATLQSQKLSLSSPPINKLLLIRAESNVTLGVCLSRWSPLHPTCYLDPSRRVAALAPLLCLDLPKQHLLLTCYSILIGVANKRIQDYFDKKDWISYYLDHRPRQTVHRHFFSWLVSHCQRHFMATVKNIDKGCFMFMTGVIPLF